MEPCITGFPLDHTTEETAATSLFSPIDKHSKACLKNLCKWATYD